MLVANPLKKPKLHIQKNYGEMDIIGLLRKRYFLKILFLAFGLNFIMIFGLS